jgi:hypothetical protein
MVVRDEIAQTETAKYTICNTTDRPNQDSDSYLARDKDKTIFSHTLPANTSQCHAHDEFGHSTKAVSADRPANAEPTLNEAGAVRGADVELGPINFSKMESPSACQD